MIDYNCKSEDNSWSWVYTFTLAHVISSLWYGILFIDEICLNF